ncbi:MAG: alanine--tRNA ligase [Thermodesulfobacteriota bacterium]|nr:alanine--tRNA ligase [Thermodesulfobacteriota bacterium]
MTGQEIREKFIEYFITKGHTLVKSSSLVPADDPTLLFTNAGMIQFKQVFLGGEKRDYVRAVSVQKCMRAGGKHNDLENVGRTARHHTFFEMLGNFSFGDYFKEEAIAFAWEFLTGHLKLPVEKLWVSVYEQDNEAYEIWRTKIGLPAERIVRLGEKDNFWAMGDTGPCGPCSEILIDQGEEIGCHRPDCRVGCDCDRYLELWNLVFMQYYRNEKGELHPLPRPSIDTGMGLERIAAVLQGKKSNYESDLFQGIISAIAGLSGTSYGRVEARDMAMRVIADHSRAAAFLIADGVLPSNEGRGYVLRRILRRAVRYGRVLGLDKPFLGEVTGAVAGIMGKTCPELIESAAFARKILLNEEERFAETLDFGLRLLQEKIADLKARGEHIISGDTVFKLYDTYGFPIDIIQDIGQENDLEIDNAGFQEYMARQRDLSKKAWKGELMEIPSVFRDLLDKGQKTEFVGYEVCSTRSRLCLLVRNGEAVAEAGKGEAVEVVVEKTPFYAEAGGQVGDQGTIRGQTGTVVIEETISIAGRLYVHHGRVIDGKIKAGEEVELAISPERRQSVALNHTATHLLHAALRTVLGEHVRQSGSLVAPDRLRFDFTHFSPVEAADLERIETIVNGKIRENIPLDTDIQALEQAIQNGATALFGEKYGDRVRVVSIGPFSKELCGGTHAARTGDIGLFKIVSEGGVAAGIRRIEAVTGSEALKLVQEQDLRLKRLGHLLKAGTEELGNKIEKLIASQKELEKEVADLTAKLTLQGLDSILQGARKMDGIRVLSTMVPIDSPKTLRELADRFRDKIGSGIVVLGGIHDDKVHLVAVVTKDLTKRFHAGDIVKKVAPLVGGSGGGRADMAQAGGTKVDKLPEALDMVYDLVEGSA